MNAREVGHLSCDYVVVGSGAGGGPLAANLARAGMTVVLLEAGGDDEGYNYQVPAFHGFATEDAELRWDYFARHYEDEKQQRKDWKFTRDRGGVLYPRAGTLGGCTAHNAMITVYPHNSDWDAIAKTTGDASWKSTNMRKYFERLERCSHPRRPRGYPKSRLLAAIFRYTVDLIPGLNTIFGNPSRHGFDGWLGTDMPDIKLGLRDDQLFKIVLNAAADTLAENLRRPLSILEGITTYLDPNDWRVQRKGAQGVWLVPMATSAGRRNGTREYIRTIEAETPKNFIVKTGALVTSVLLDERSRAFGVEYLEGRHLYRADPNVSSAGEAGRKKRILVRREVILSAGAFNTPQLLMLSGIGPSDQLKEHGIAVRVDLPGVGKNLQDRYEVGVVAKMKEPFETVADCTFEAPVGSAPADPCFSRWREGEGPYATNGVALGLIKRSRPDIRDPDLFIFGLPARFEGYYPGYSQKTVRRKDYFTWAILKAHTKNTKGEVRLRSADPRDVPYINFHYFDEGNDESGEDLASVVSGIKFVRHLMSHTQGVMDTEVTPGTEVRTEEQLADFIRENAWGHHASCTCKMGTAEDPMAVVDSNFRVFGVQNLRIVDASIFPRIPGFFIASAIYMASEKASEVILNDALGNSLQRTTSSVRDIATRVGDKMKRSFDHPARKDAQGRRLL